MTSVSATTTTATGGTVILGTYDTDTSGWDARALAARYALSVLANGGRIDPVPGERDAYTITPDVGIPETIRFVRL